MISARVDQPAWSTALSLGPRIAPAPKGLPTVGAANALEQESESRPCLLHSEGLRSPKAQTHPPA